MPIIKFAVFLASSIMFFYAWVYYPITKEHSGDFIAMLSGRENDFGYWNGQGVGYGPIFALYDLLFRGVTDLMAMRVMYVVNLTMLFVAFFIVMRRFLPKPRTSGESLAAVFIWVFFYPTFQALRQNNVEITELLFIVLMIAALLSRKDVIAGVCLGVAGATKILPFALIIYFLWRRRFRLATTAMLTGIVLFALIIVLKKESIPDVFTNWLEYAVQPWPKETQNNQAISGLVWRAFSQFDFSTRWTIEKPLVLDPISAHLVTLLASLFFFGIVLFVLIKRTGLFPPALHDVRIETVEIAIVLISMLLLISHNHTHYFILIAWIYIGALREWPCHSRQTTICVNSLFVLSFVLLGMLHLWRLIDPFLYPLGPVTGVDLARLASLPFFGAVAGLTALLIIHGRLLSVSEVLNIPPQKRG